MPIDYKKYCQNWKLISAFIRFGRAKNKCEFCKAENYKPHPVTKSKVILTVAHLDHNKKNNRLSNLKALCQRCHLRYDINHHVRNRAENKNKIMEQSGQLSFF
jgi:5-methylcytosine-specific restriction endonuclease McrA